MLDAVLGRLFRGGKAIVSTAVEVFKAAGGVLQLIGLAWHDRLLLGNTARMKRV